MFIINKVVSNYEGTFANPLMYEADLEKAKKIVDELQLSVIYLKQTMIEITQEVYNELNKTHPNFYDRDMRFEEKMQSIVPGDDERYFEKEERLFKELIDKHFNKKEQYFYELFDVRTTTGIIYFEVQELLSSDEVLTRAIVGEDSFNVVYSTQEKAQEHKAMFDTLAVEYHDDID